MNQWQMMAVLWLVAFITAFLAHQNYGRRTRSPKWLLYLIVSLTATLTLVVLTLK